MNIIEIHDLSNKKAINILKNEFSKIDDIEIIKNYHPDYSENSSNLFYILKNGRYSMHKGKYFIILDNNDYVASAGWNQYELDTSIALVLTRMYVSKQHRGKYYIGNNVLPIILNETSKYDKVWMTANKHNISIYKWVERNYNKLRPTLFNNWPPIYKKFVPIGIKNIYYTEQYVMEYNND